MRNKFKNTDDNKHRTQRAKQCILDHSQLNPTHETARAVRASAAVLDEGIRAVNVAKLPCMYIGYCTIARRQTARGTDLLHDRMDKTTSCENYKFIHRHKNG